jgi:hypothetical protein
MSQSSILVDALSSAYLMEKRSGGEKWPGGLFLRADALLAVPHRDFSGYLVQLKAVLRVSS